MAGQRWVQRHRWTAVAASVVVLSAMVGWTGGPADASAPKPANSASAAPQVPTAAVFPPRANSAWVYDSDGPGTWIDAIKDYNRQAGAERELNQIYSYGTDMEMYCPDNDASRCTAEDFYSFYTPGGSGYDSTAAYHQAFNADDPGTLVLSPIIDGRTDANGYLQGFNDLSPELAAVFADKVAAQVCADPHIDGIQFDVEPFDVTSKNGQYYFYLQLARNFAGLHSDDPADDPYDCVDPEHPSGRFYSVFTFAEAINPHTESAGNVRDILNTYGNGYLMVSLYDLSSAPAGTLNGLDAYRKAVQREALLTKHAANRLDIKYGFGIPASSSAHEYTTCIATPVAVDACVPDETGAVGHPMIDYAKAAVRAIDRSRAPHDPAYIGVAIWDFGDYVSWNGLDFGPVPPPAEVLDYFAAHLPGTEVPGMD